MSDLVGRFSFHHPFFLASLSLSFLFIHCLPSPLSNWVKKYFYFALVYNLLISIGEKYYGDLLDPLWAVPFLYLLPFMGRWCC